MCIMCGHATCGAEKGLLAPGQDEIQTGESAAFRLTTAIFDDNPRSQFLKWGDDELGRASGEITWSMSLAGLDFDGMDYSIAQFEQAVQAAFDAWAAVADLTFRMVTGDADIDIVTATEAEVPNLAGNTVGLASYSFSTGADRFNDVAEIFASTIYMDLAETWSPFGGSDTNPNDADGDLSFFGVLLHEIGHALGLDHVADTSEIMNATISTNTLGDGDIEGIRELYGLREFPVGFGTDAADTINLSGEMIGVSIVAGAGNDMVSATQGNDTITGGAGNDTISGNGGADLIIDTLGTNTLNGNDNNDVIVGGSGTTNADGGSGSDIILGGIGDDTLRGGSGNDTLRGDPGGFFFGDDVLHAGTGTDYLEGGGGADTFVFNTGEGTNFIARLNINVDNPNSTSVAGADFDSGIDQVDLTDFGYVSVAEVFDHITTSGGYAVFEDQGTVIHFVDVQVAMLSENDFLI